MNIANKINKWTPLIAAAIYGRDEIVKILINCGVDIDAQNSHVLYNIFFFFFKILTLYKCYYS